MASPRTVTPESVDRRLRRAGHRRHDRRLVTGYSPGYVVGWASGVWPSETTVVTWNDDRLAADTPAARDAERQALRPLADTLTTIGYAVIWDELSVDAGGVQFRFPCLLVQALED